MSLRPFVLSIFEWPLKTGFTVLPLLSEAGLGLGGTAGFNLQKKKEHMRMVQSCQVLKHWA